MRFQPASHTRLSASRNHPPTDNSSTPTKITKLGFLSLPLLAFNRRFTMSELKKQIHIIPPGKRALAAGLVFWLTYHHTFAS